MPFTLDQQLSKLTPDERADLKQALLQTASSAAVGFGQGALAGLQGRPLSGVASGGSLGDKKQLSPDEEIDIFEKKERIKAKIKQEFGGSGGMQIVQLPGGGFAVIPGGAQSAEGVASDLATKKDAQGNPVGLEDVTIKSGGISGKVPKSEEQLGRELSEEQQKGISKGKVEALGKSTTAQRMSLQQIDLISNSARLLAETHIGAIREGGMGSLFNEFRGKASLFFGGEQSEQFEQTEAFSGLKTEVVARLMPTLTQQGDKPGSVRLVQTIFAKLELTLPGNRTPAKNAKNMLEKTLTNAFNFSRAAHRLGLTNESVENLNDEELESFSLRVETLAEDIVLSDDEQSALDSLLANALAPYDEFISERDQGDSKFDKEFEEFLRKTR